MKNVLYVLIPQEIKVRRYKVDEKCLQQLLKNHKTLSNKEIARRLNIKVTTVEHWFRRDNYFCIPDPDDWFRLKELLNIDYPYLDKSIITFDTKIGTFEKAERVYLINGLSPCLLASGVESILVKENV